MDISSLPLVLFLLFPGFLLLHTIFVISRIRHVSPFYLTMWSLGASLLLISAVYPLYILRVHPPPDVPAWPGLRQVLADPSKVPGPVLGILYALALIIGTILGILDRKHLCEKTLRLFKVDIEAHYDLWYGILNDNNYETIMVYLKDGTLISGWPEFFSNDREPPGPEIYLSDYWVWDADTKTWKKPEGTLGVLVHGNEISRIEFVQKV